MAGAELIADDTAIDAGDAGERGETVGAAHVLPWWSSGRGGEGGLIDGSRSIDVLQAGGFDGDSGGWAFRGGGSPSRRRVTSRSASVISGSGM
ncbi:MAG: hypothetical protein IPK52_18320 [Chloroflexi bacterium]|nr:hypothetical protein [Chloroflexota bacterium]